MAVKCIGFHSLGEILPGVTSTESEMDYFFSWKHHFCFGRNSVNAYMLMVSTRTAKIFLVEM